MNNDNNNKNNNEKILHRKHGPLHSMGDIVLWRSQSARVNSI